MATRKVHTRLAEFMEPVIQRARISCGAWLEGVTHICLADVRKMFASHGNPKEITELGENEAVAIAAFEFCEDLAGKREQRKACGYTRKFRMVDKLNALEIYGKAMAYSADRREITSLDGAPLTLTVEFVDGARSEETDAPTGCLLVEGSVSFKLANASLE